MKVSRGALLTLVDQVLSSATNFVPALFAAHTLEPRDFGTFALLQATYVLLIGAVRSGLVETAVVTKTSASHHRGIPTSCAIWLSLMIVVPTALVAFAVGSPAVLLSAAALGLVVVQDTQRIENLTSGREADATRSDLAWLVIIAGIVGVCALQDRSPDPTALFQLWALAAVPGTLVLALARRNLVGPRSSLLFVTAERATISTHLGDWGLRQGLTQTTLYVVATAAGLSVVGYIRLAQLLLGPINIVFAAVQLVAIPRVARAAKDSWVAFRDLVVRWGVAQTLLPLLFGLTVLSIPVEALRLALGDQASGLKAYLIPQVVLLAVSGAAATAQIGIKVLHLRLQLLRTRVITCGVTLVSTLSLAVPLDSALAALWGLALGSGISAGIWQYVLWTHARQMDYAEV